MPINARVSPSPKPSLVHCKSPILFSTLQGKVTCSPSMAVWLSGSLRKNCFSSPCASDTMIVEANMAENVLEEVVIRLEEEASVVEEVRAEARMMMVVVASISRMALPPQLQVPIFHFSQITKGTFYLL